MKKSIIVVILTAIAIVAAIYLNENNNIDIDTATTVAPITSSPIASVTPTATPNIVDGYVLPRSCSTEDFICLASCLDYEAEGEPLGTKLLYGSVIINRLISNNHIFKNYKTIKDVCNQNEGDGGFPAFRKYGKKRLNEISKSSKDAAAILLSEGTKLPAYVLYHDTVEKTWAKTYMIVENQSTPGYTYFQYIQEDKP